MEIIAFPVTERCCCLNPTCKLLIAPQGQIYFLSVGVFCVSRSVAQMFLLLTDDILVSTVE